MTQRSKRIMSVTLTLLMVLSVLVVGLPTDVFAANGTGYTTSSDVKYETEGKYTVNWGYAGEDCTFLSPYANGFYTSDYSFETLSKLKGGNSQGTAPQSELYQALQELMKSKHTYVNNYDETRFQYMYTDCQLNDTSKIVSFYSGESFDAIWDSGKTWNREHTWPASKSLGGRDEKEDSADIMMLRPTLKSENGSRGNKGYGESSGYYNPDSVTKAEGKEDHDVRGDCARIFLYVYVRWGLTDGNGKYTTWGTSGVMENLNVLLKWMEEDPVDTWEMGRNDAVQSITGTRNVFVDYPEYAWLLFGENVPTGMTTPSQNGSDGVTANPGDYVDNSNDNNGSDDNNGSGSIDSDGATAVETPVADTAYKLRMNHEKNGAIYYFNGDIYISSKGSYAWYLGTTTKKEEAVDVYVQAVDGGYTLYFLKNGSKVYINMYQKSGRTDASLSIDGTQETTVYTWDTKYKTFVATVKGEKYFIGTSNTANYTSFSANAYSNIGSYFLGQLYAVDASNGGSNDSTGGDSNGSTTTPTTPTPTAPAPTNPTPAPTESTPVTDPSATEPTVTDPTENQPSTDATKPTESAPTDPTEATKPTDPTVPSENKPNSTEPVKSEDGDGASSAIVVVCIVIVVMAIGCVVIYINKKRSDRCE